MISIPLDPVLVWLMVFLRTGLILAFFPLFGEGFVPLRIRVILGAVVAFALTPVVPITAAQFPDTTGGMVMMGASEALLGISVGLVGRGLFSVIQFAGQIGGEQMGFGLVNAIDPTGSHQISVVAEMEYLLGIMVFLTADMHHAFLGVMAASFEILEPGQAVFTGGVAEFFLDLGRVIFSLAVQFAMPVIVVIFVINVAMAMMGRAVPQINVFLESFPLRIIGGIVVTSLSLGLLVRLWLNMFGSMDSMLATLLRAMQG